MNKRFQFSKFIRTSQISLLIILLISLSCLKRQMTVKEVMDDIVTRLYETKNKNELNQLKNQMILDFISEKEKNIFATEYWTFDVNVPVVISIMRHQEQKIVPFWLTTENGFTRTDLIVKNEEYTYEVWQKKFNSGRVKLGINGFDKHRPVYFVSVAPQHSKDKVELSNFFPSNQHLSTMEVGTYTYHDWHELVLLEIPHSLKGQILLTTIRGRAREAHLINAFRKTDFPSSQKPDQILLTWKNNPQTSQMIQWRTSTTVTDGVVRFHKKRTTGDEHFSEIKADFIVMEDRLLHNDRYIHRFSANLKDLEPSTTYVYRVGSPAKNFWSKEAEFRTAPASKEPFSFIYFGDTHRSPHWGKLINAVFERHPETAFYTIAGDVVSTGLYRNEWDELFFYSKDVIKYRPLMPSLGNHDSQDRLGVWMYLDLFELPYNGPPNIEKERLYSFEYSNAFFMILDVTLPVKDQVAWIEKQLSSTTATWKFAVFHFPPYMYKSDYQDIRELWGALFDKYHLDMAFSGHFHTYVRSKPMFAEKPVSSPEEGTIYITSVAIPSRDDEIPDQDYAEVYFAGGSLYQKIDINDKQMTYKCMDISGNIRDEIILNK